MKPTDNMRWITSAEAAEIWRMSRPLVERILGRYPGEIRWSSVGAQPSVIAGQFEAWIEPAWAAADPGDLDEIGAEAILDPVSSTEKSDPETRAASRARALELAKKLRNR